MHLIENEDDKLVLIDQRSEREYIMGGVYTDLAEKEERESLRVSKEVQRRVNEKIRKCERVCSTSTVGLFSSSESVSDNSRTEKSGSEEYANPHKTQKRAKVGAKPVVTPEVAAVLDHTHFSDRKTSCYSKSWAGT